MKVTRVIAGAILLSSSSDFPNIAYSMKVKPVTLPPGRARLEMKPCPTGSFSSTKTIGIERITCTASERVTLPFATMMSGASRAISVTSPRTRPTSPAVQYQSMRRFFPSVQPSACRPCRKAAARDAHLVRPGDEHIRQRNAERCRCLQIDGHVKARRLLDRHVGRLGTPRKPLDITRDVIKQSHEVEAVADQRAGLHVLPECCDRRNATLEQCLRDGRAVAQESPACGQNDRLPAGIIHRAKRAHVVLLAFDLDHARLQAQLAGRLGCCIALLVRKRVESDADEGRARERLASDLNAFGGELDLAHENAGHIAAGM